MCLTDNAGDIAWVRLNDTLEHFKVGRLIFVLKIINDRRKMRRSIKYRQSLARLVFNVIVIASSLDSKV